jgi:hypothetical protein
MLTGRKGVSFALIAFPIATILPIVWYLFLHQPQSDDIEKIIKQAGFQPLLPPNRLRGPGALYEVDSGYYRKVCDVDLKLLEGKLKSSPTTSQFRQKLERGGFSLTADFLDTLNSKVTGGRITAVQLKLSDVAITEIPMSDLSEIEDLLLSQKQCDSVVQKLLKANKKVCAGYAALSATTIYKVNVDNKFAADTKAVQTALQERAGAEIAMRTADEFRGDNLFYGIQLSELCITSGDATEPSVLPPLDASAKAIAPKK